MLVKGFSFTVEIPIRAKGMCKILLEGQMSGKKWEDALSFKCTLVGEYI
jgi:DNA repair protein RadC